VRSFRGVRLRNEAERLFYVRAHNCRVPNITLSLPADLHRKMKRHPEVKWSEVVRGILADKIRDFEVMERIAAKGRRELTPEEIDELDHRLKRAALRRIERRVEG